MVLWPKDKALVVVVYEAMTQPSDLLLKLCGLKQLVWQRRKAKVEEVGDLTVLETFGLGERVPDTRQVCHERCL